MKSVIPAIPFQLFRTVLFAFLFFLTGVYQAAAQGKRIYITKGADNGRYINGTSFACAPGDTLVLKASGNPYTYFAMEHLHGTAARPIVVINEGGQVLLRNGMALYNCTHVVISGTGSRDLYGFRIESADGAGVAIDITKRSAWIEAHHLDIYKKTYGFWVKQEGSCADSLQYPNWVIHDISIHDNRIIKMGQEGMYLGSTDPNGLRTVNCNGQVITPKPLRLGNIIVFNNIVDSTNRSGIQLSGADSGKNEIYSNKVSHAGLELSDVQGNGISLGGYTHAHVHHNIIRNTFANGILVLGAGLIRVDHNTIDNSGHLGEHTVPGMACIMVDTRVTRPVDSSQLIITDNQLGVNTDYSIRFYKTVNTYSKRNVIYNNTGNLKMAPGIYWSESHGGRVKTSFATFIPRYRYIAIGLAVLVLLGIVFVANRLRKHH